MNLSRNWLAQYVNTGSDVAELCRKLTMAGIEVESVEMQLSPPSESPVLVTVGLSRVTPAREISRAFSSAVSEA